VTPAANNRLFTQPVGLSYSSKVNYGKRRFRTTNIKRIPNLITVIAAV
jgi:hypothetical protein